MLTYDRIQNEVVDILLPPGSNPTTVDAEPEFAKKVRLASIILKANNPISYDDIRRATPGAYHRIALRIAAARFPNVSAITQNADGSQTLQDNSNRIDFQWLENDVIAMLVPYGDDTTPDTDLTATRTRAFSGGLEWAASKLVAAHVVRNIPLNNSSLKFVDVADNLETQALEDIDRIIRIEQGSASSGSTSTDSAATQGQYTLYIAHDLDLTTIPSTAFDVPDPPPNPLPPNYTPTYERSVNVTGVSTYQNVVVPSGKLSYCHVHMTAQSPIADQDLIGTRAVGSNVQIHPQTSNAVSYSIRLNIPILDGWTIDDIISELADNINSACLTAGNGNSTLSNILVAPQRGKQNAQRQTAVKGELYPNATNFVTRTASFDLIYRLNSLNFTPRRYSSKVSTEMMTITFFTVDDPATVNLETPIPGQLNHNEYEYTGIGTDDSLSLIKRNNPSFELGIEGLVHGALLNYSSLDKVSPKGFFLTVEKGDRPSVSIESAGSTGTDSFDTENILDTFYFYAENPLPINSTLTLRVSTTEYNAALARPISIDVSGMQGPAIAEKVVDALYDYAVETNTDQDAISNSGILGVLLGDYERIYTKVDPKFNTAIEIPLEEELDINNQFTGVNANPGKDVAAGRVQIVGFKYKDNEYKAVVDILSVPTGLEVAVGNYELRKTSWSTRRRSVQIDLKTLTGSSAVTQQTTAEELSSVNASVGKAEATKSRLLQQVYDKLRLLDEAKKGFPTKWHSQT